MKLKFIITGILSVCNGFMINAKDQELAAFSQLGSTAPSSQFHFIDNVGQIKDQYGQQRNDIDVKLTDNKTSLFIGSGHIHYQWYQPQNIQNGSSIGLWWPKPSKPYVADWNTYRVDLSLIGADPNALLIKESKVTYQERYYGTNIPEKGYIASGYNKLTYKNVYPQIDWVIYIKDKTLEYDFVVHPGGKVTDIRLSYQGSESVSLREDGSLLVKSPLGSITEQAPHTFQADGKVVASRFVVDGQNVSFATAPYEGTLTIDPRVHWGTYVGGDYFFDEIEGVYADGKGMVYALGRSTSTTNIATTGAFQAAIQGFDDAILLKFNEKGQIQWGTYYGGIGRDDGGDITADSSGNLFISIRTDSPTGLATAGTHQNSSGGAGEIVVAKFNTEGQRIWATYFGGTEDDNCGKGLISDGSAVYLMGTTFSKNSIATSGTFQPNKSGDVTDLDVFLVKFDEHGRQAWSTYIGTPTNDYGGGIAIDSKGYVYISGFTYGGAGLATPGTHQPNLTSSPTTPYDAFLIKFDQTGNRTWGTYYGGEKDDWAGTLICDNQDNIYMSGSTQSTTGIATPNSHQTSFSNTTENDHFIVKFNEKGIRQWATYYGGTGYEGGNMLTIMNSNQLFLSGTTGSTTGIATSNAIQPNFSGEKDMYVAQFNLDGVRQWATYYGGPGTEWLYSAFADRSNLYLAGNTTSASGVATPGSFMSVYPNPILYSGLFVKLCFAAVSGHIQGKDSVCAGSTQTYSLPEMDEVDAYIWTLPSNWAGTSDSRTIDLTTGDISGEIKVKIVRCGDTSVVSTFPVHVYPKDIPVINVNNFELGVAGGYASYQWLLNGSTLTGADKATYTVKENGNYQVITTNKNGCADTSAIYTVNNVSITEKQGLRKLINIYPNPGSDFITIDAPMPVTITISSIEGKVQGQYKASKKFSIADLATGIYLITLKDQQGTVLQTTKWIKL